MLTAKSIACRKNFMETVSKTGAAPVALDTADRSLQFDLTGRKVYLTGESYAGQYIPYIAYYMLEANNTDYYNVKGIQINDPSINEDSTMMYGTLLPFPWLSNKQLLTRRPPAPAVPALNKYASVFGLNDSFMADINERAVSCGYIEFLDYALSFPPPTKLPSGPNISAPGCAVWDDIVTAAITVNPCFNFYHLTDYCPYLWDELGFPSLGWGPNSTLLRLSCMHISLLTSSPRLLQPI